MELSRREASLIQVVRGLPETEAEKVLTWAHQLADLAGGRQIEWSDSWSDEDLLEATTSSISNLEQGESERA